MGEVEVLDSENLRLGCRAVAVFVAVVRSQRCGERVVAVLSMLKERIHELGV